MSKYEAERYFPGAPRPQQGYVPTPRAGDPNATGYTAGGDGGGGGSGVPAVDDDTVDADRDALWMRSYRERIATLGSDADGSVIDCNRAPIWIVGGSPAVTFADPYTDDELEDLDPERGTLQAGVTVWTMGGQPTFPGVQWEGGEVPALTGKCCLVFTTIDRGATWQGMVGGLDFKAAAP